jgi:hypothetical protein
MRYDKEGNYCGFDGFNTRERDLQKINDFSYRVISILPILDNKYIMDIKPFKMKGEVTTFGLINEVNQFEPEKGE